MLSTHEPAHKVARHRERMRAIGLRLIQLWVPDTRTAKFSEEIKCQCLSLKNDPAEAGVLHFTEEATTYIDGWK